MIIIAIFYQGETGHKERMASTETNVVRLGLMGAGGRLQTVLRLLLAEAPAGRLRVAAVYDPDPGAIRALRKNFGSGFEEMATEEALSSHPGLDWILIGSWNAFHAGQAVSALQAGKNVFCEKPLATTLEDCLAVRNAVEKSGRIFSFGLVLRYSPHYQKIRELAAGGKIGKLVSFEFNETLSFNHGGYIFGNWRRYHLHSGGHLLEKCCHDLDLAHWIIGSLPRKVASFGGRDFFTPENERHIARIGPNPQGKPAYGTWKDPHRTNPFGEGADIVDNQVAILQYANGVRATFHTNCNAGLPERRFYLCGTEGSIRADAVTGRIEWQAIGHDSRMEEINLGHAGAHAGGDEVMARALVETILHGKDPLATVRHGIESSLAAFALDRAMKEEKIIDLLPEWEKCGIRI